MGEFDGGVTYGATLTVTPAATVDLSDAVAQTGNLLLEADQDITLNLTTMPVEGRKFILLFKSTDATNRTLTFNGAHFRLPNLTLTTGTTGLYTSVEFFVSAGKANRCGVASSLIA